MMNHRLECLMVGGLLCLTGTVVSEPLPDQHPQADGAGPGEVWGDPEENSEPQPGWTWFGMGYERRAQQSGVANPNESVTANGQSGGGKPRK